MEVKQLFAAQPVVEPEVLRQVAHLPPGESISDRPSKNPRFTGRGLD
jgi:hypothetical protein